jgi:hypothetical protein
MAKYIGNGTTLAVSTGGSTAAATAIGGIMMVNGPDGSGANIDTTTLDSTSNYQTWRRGFRDAGEWTMDVAYDPSDAGWLKVKAMDASGVAGSFVVTFASTALSDETMTGYINNVGRSIPRDGMITRSITVHASSGPGFN